MESEKDCQTTKIDIRAAIFREEKVLLVQEQDSRWTLPGGWCDMRLSVRENAVQYAKEQTGVDISVNSIVSVHTDGDRGIYRFLLLCSPLSESPQPNGKISAIGYFGLGDISPLATDTVTEDMIYTCFDACRSENWKTLVD